MRVSIVSGSPPAPAVARMPMPPTDDKDGEREIVKYNLIELCWSALEKKSNGVLLNGLKVVLQCALRMTWKGSHPTVKRLHGAYPDGIRFAAKEMKGYEARLRRSATLPKYDILIKPRATEQQGK